MMQLFMLPSGFGRVLLFFALAVCSRGATAQDPAPHHAQTGALLGHAASEARVLYTALLAREFDVDLSRMVAEELGRSIRDAQKSADRSIALLDEKQAKLKPELEKLRATLKQTIEQFGKLEADLKSQTSGLGSSEGEESTGVKAEEKQDPPSSAPTKLNWEVLKSDASWLAADLADARAQAAKLDKALGIQTSTSLPKPKGKRS